MNRSGSPPEPDVERLLQPLGVVLVALRGDPEILALHLGARPEIADRRLAGGAAVAVGGIEVVDAETHRLGELWIEALVELDAGTKEQDRHRLAGLPTGTACT